MKLGYCGIEYSDDRNDVVKQLNIAFLGTNRRHILDELDLPGDLKLDPAANKLKLIEIRDGLNDFLVKHENTVCKGLVLRCKSGFTEPHCISNYYQSEWVEIKIANNSL